MEKLDWDRKLDVSGETNLPNNHITRVTFSGISGNVYCGNETLSEKSAYADILIDIAYSDILVWLLYYCLPDSMARFVF